MKTHYFVQFDGHDGGWLTRHEVTESSALMAEEKYRILNLNDGEAMVGDGVVAYREDA